MTEVTLTALRKDLFRLVDSVLETGEPLVIRRGGRRLTLDWRETGGPVPTPPEAGAGGFGSTLMKRVISGVRGQTEMSYPETGAVIRMTLPTDMLRPNETQSA